MTHAAACRLLVIFSRYPRPGNTKTRLIPRLGAEGAASLQRLMTGHTVLTARCLSPAQPVNLELCFTGCEADSMRTWLGRRLACRPQGQGDLGARLARALQGAFARGAGRVVIVGTDCPGLTGPMLTRAFDALDRCDAVVGPAADGGYYLVGLSLPEPRVFDGMPWGTQEVLGQTVRRLHALGLTVERLAQLPDVDRPEDLPFWTAVAPPAFDADDATPRITQIRPGVAAAHASTDLEAETGSETIWVKPPDAGRYDACRDSSCAGSLVDATSALARAMNRAALAAGGHILVFRGAENRDAGDQTVARLLSVLRRSDRPAGAVIASASAGRRPASALPLTREQLRMRLDTSPATCQALALPAVTFRVMGGFG